VNAARSQPLRAALLMLGSTVFFGLMTVAIKLASASLHTFEIAFFRNFFGLMAALPLLLHHGPELLKTAQLPRYLFRCTIGVTSMMAGFWAIGHLPLAQAVALFAWLEAVLLVAQAAQFLLTVPAPGLAEVIGILSFALFLWLLTVFVAELHGFVRPGLVLLSILATGFVLALVVAIVLVAVFGAEGVSGV